MKINRLDQDDNEETPIKSSDNFDTNSYKIITQKKIKRNFSPKEI